MTKGAQANMERRLKEKEIETNKQINKERLEDNERQRQFDKKERRKDRWANFATSFIKGIKLPTVKNDPAFYKKFIDVLDRFVNVPTYQRLGSESFAKTKLTSKNGSNNNLTVPGIMVLLHLPTIGPELGSGTSYFPINQSLNRDKEQILKLNSRSSVNYEGADIGLNLFCTAEIVSMLCEIRRALIIYQTYRGDNAYLAQQYITALRINYSDLDNNIATYRKHFNVAVRKFNSSVVAPADVTLYARKIYLASNVFKDRDGEVKQVYMFKQAHFHSLNNVGDGTQIFDASQPVNLSQYFTWLNLMMERITANPDYVEMYADMRHAITNLLTLDPEIKPDATIEFNADPLNRAQIHNIRSLPYFGALQYSGFAEIDPSDWLLHLDTNGYLYQGSSTTNKRRITRSLLTGDTTDHIHNWSMMLKYIYSNVSGSRKLTLFDMDKDVITGDDILDITRFNIGSDSVGIVGNKVYMDVTDCGTEVIWYYTMTAMTTTGLATSIQQCTEDLVVSTDTPIISDKVDARTMYMLSKFDWAPPKFRYVCSATVQATDPDASVEYWNHIGDLDHSFAINFEDMSSINEACVLSEFYLTGTTFNS